MSHGQVNPYEQALERNAANFVSLSPLTFLERAATVYPNRIDDYGGGNHRFLSRKAGAFQGAQDGRLRIAARDRHRQDPEIRTA